MRSRERSIVSCRSVLLRFGLLSLLTPATARADPLDGGLGWLGVWAAAPFFALWANIGLTAWIFVAKQKRVPKLWIAATLIQVPIILWHSSVGWDEWNVLWLFYVVLLLSFALVMRVRRGRVAERTGIG